MADIKFRCPECTQKIAVAETAAGVKIDCPTCHSRLVIPRSPIMPVEVLIKRRLAIIGGSADAVYTELQKMEVQAEKAGDEIKRMRAEHAAAALNARQEIEGLTSARKALESELDSLRPLREQLARAQQEIASSAAQQAELKAAQEAAGTLRKELTALRATHDETQGRLSTITTQLGGLQSERDALAQTAAENAAALRTELTTLQTAHGETQGRLFSIAEQLSALQGERDTLAQAASEAAGLREQLDEARKDAARAQSTAETTAKAHSAQLDAAKGIEAGVRAELAAVQTQHKQAEERLTEQAAKIAALDAENAELAAFVEQLLPLREQLATAQTDLCNLCEATAEKARGYEAQIEAAKASEAEARGALGDWQSRHAAAQGQIAEMEKRAEELQKDAAATKSLGENLASVQGELKRAQEQAELSTKARDETLAGAQAAEKSLREHCDALKARLQDTERRHAAVSHGFSALKQERGDLTNELTALRKERDDAAAMVADHSKTIEKLTPAMETAKGELARLREAANAAAVENGRISAALEKASAARSELLERCKQLEAAAATDEKEIACLKQLVESADAGAKSGDTKLQQLAARTESMTTLLAEKQAATREALARAEQLRTEQAAAQDRAQKAERAAAEAAERAVRIETEKTALTAELSRKSAELDALKNEAAQTQDTLAQIKAQPKDPRTDSAPPTEREKSLEAERDALAAALERAKQHVGVLQARRDMLRDEVATLRSRLGIGGKVTSGDEKPIAK